MTLFSKTHHQPKRLCTILFTLLGGFILLLLLQCNPPAEHASSAVNDTLIVQRSSFIPQAKEITLIIKDFPTLEKEIKTAAGYPVWHMNSGFFYFDDLSMEAIDMADNTQDDTVTLASYNDKIIVRCRYNFIDYYEYLVQKGDTITFTYQNGFPSASLSNRTTLPYDLAFDDLVRKRYLKEKYAPTGKYKDIFAFYDFTKPRKEKEREEQTVRAKIYKEAIPYLENQQRLLDSLKATNNISADVYDFYKNRAYYLVQWLHLKEGTLATEQVSQLLHQELPANMPAFYRRQFVESVADKYMVEKADYLDLKDGVNRDYRQAYVAIKNSPLFTDKDRSYLLTREMQRIADTFSETDFQTYFTQFEQDVKDEALLSSLKDKYALKFDKKSSETESVVLMAQDKKQLTFEDIKKRYSGKVLYIDFWASWCGPCREVMPQSIELKESLKNNDVVFVYLSIDKVFKAWQKASVKEGLDKHAENYLVVNADASDFIRAQKIDAIPRYMIFDKEGKLAYPNAPSVTSKELKAILLELAEM